MSFPTFTENLQDVLIEFEKALPALNSSQYWYELGDYYKEKLDNFIKAEYAYKKVLELSPNDAWVYFDIGSVLDSQEKYKEALIHHLKAVELDATEHIFWDSVAYSATHVKDYNTAIKMYLKLIRMGYSSKYCNYYQSLADCYLAIKQNKKAIKAMLYSLKRDFDDCSIIYNLACIYAINKDKTNTLLYLEKSYQITDKNNASWAEKDKDFKNFWKDKDFKALIEKYK